MILTTQDKALLRAHHIAWEQEEDREQAKPEIVKHCQMLQGKLMEARATLRFWRALFFVLAGGLAIVAVVDVLTAWILG